MSGNVFGVTLAVIVIVLLAAASAIIAAVAFTVRALRRRAAPVASSWDGHIVAVRFERNHAMDNHYDSWAVVDGAGGHRALLADAPLAALTQALPDHVAQRFGD